jgi:uncharacterized membrane protein
MAKSKSPTKKNSVKRPWTLESVMPWLLAIGGAIGTLASLLLTIEVFDRLKNPHFVPICNLNPVLSCSSVADSHQAHAFGFPNYFIGIAGFAAVATIGVAMLAGGVFKRWFWRLTEVGLLFGSLQGRCSGIRLYTIYAPVILKLPKNWSARLLLPSGIMEIFYCSGL